ncbi:MAG: FMN-binding negative transcriptional regulator [Alphaproteobacteria bacterium]|nr:FMN-binding negative transcriptional regulator [Alphaproteobacteria bacterium]MBL6936575.1 FMN-binding negative transcriptional regulator [Alphaproteobacteria bacterium]MBL7098374.1 FMN-binding negative transcriptional regulator [Alphaproteobacteria bacterium]
MSMYRPPAFASDDRAAIHAVIRQRVFGTLAAVVDGTVAFAYAPVVLDAARNAVRFHLARANPLAALADGTELTLSFVGPDAYVSPDWYETRGRVPTWNYVAVEGRGRARRLEGTALRQLLVDVSAAEETKLLPKAPWTIDKVPADKLAGLLNAIVGFEVTFETLEGKFKLSQNVPAGDVARVIDGLVARGDPASMAVAHAMRPARLP